MDKKSARRREKKHYLSFDKPFIYCALCLDFLFVCKNDYAFVLFYLTLKFSSCLLKKKRKCFFIQLNEMDFPH